MTPIGTFGWTDVPAGQVAPPGALPMTAANLEAAYAAGGAYTDALAARMIAAGALTPGLYGASGAGLVDETAALNSFYAAAKERAGVLTPGQYRVDGTLKVPVMSDIAGVNERTTRLVKNGNGPLHELEGGFISYRNVGVEASGEQAAGAAFDFSGAGDNVRLERIRVGSNFFNVFLLVPTTEGGSIVLRGVRGSALGTGIKGTKGAFLVCGSSAHRLIDVTLDDIRCVAATKGDMGTWMEVNNCDSLTGSNTLFQTGKKGLVIGNADASAERTTNLKLSNFIVDGGGENFDQAFLVTNAFASDITACNAQGGEVYFGENVHGFTWNGGAIQANKRWGLRLGGAAAFPINFNGVKIGNNNREGSAVPVEGSDIIVEPGAARALFNGCPLGNVFNYGGGSQSLYAVCFAKTGHGEKIVFAACPYTPGGSLKGIVKYEWERTEAENKVYGLTAGNPVPTPLEW